MNIMILDILQTIINFNKLENQLKYTEINVLLHENLKIYTLSFKNIYDINTFTKLDQKIIEQKKYNNLKILRSELSHITDVNHLCDTLEVLSCTKVSDIDQNGIKDLKKLRKLICNANPKLNNVNHLCDTLEKL